MKQLLRVQIFFGLWGTYHYENRIDASLAWELAGIFAEYDDELRRWEEFPKEQARRVRCDGGGWA